MTALALTQDEFAFISALIKQRSGIALTPDKGYLIDTRLGPIAKANGLADIRELIGKLRTNPNAPIAYQVVESMTTNESMFFRDTKPFDQLVKVILPALKAAGKNSIRIGQRRALRGRRRILSP